MGEESREDETWVIRLRKPARCARTYYLMELMRLTTSNRTAQLPDLEDLRRDSTPEDQP